MTRPVRALALAGGLLPLLVAIPSPAATTGIIEGRVINESTGQPQPGVELTLTTGTADGGGEVVETAHSDEHGRYRFIGLATGEDRFYALDARFDGGLFAGRPVPLPSDTRRQPVIESTLRVWATTSDPAVVAIERDDMFVVPDDDGVGVIESVTFFNASDEAYIGRGADMLGDSATGASFAFALPAAAEWRGIIDSTLDIPQLVAVNRGMAATIAIPPGEHQTTFSYRLGGTGGSFDLSRPALYPTVEMSIFAAAPLEIRSNRLVPRESETLGGKTYSRWSTDEPIDAGDPLQALAVAQGAISLGPLALAGSAVIVLVALLATWLRARRRGRPVAPGRDHLVERVAELDLAFEAGAIDRKKWDEERSDLVARLRKQEKVDR